MGKIIAIANQKGGVGKTTTAINLSASLGEKGKKVLLIDSDPQGNTSSGLGIDGNQAENSTYDCLVNEVPMQDAIVKTDYKNLWLCPGNISLAGAELELVEQKNREYQLKNAVSPIRENYDFIIIDCPPSLGLLTLNAFGAADSVLIPIQCEYYALEGLSQLTRTIKMVKQGLNKDLKIEGVLLTMFDARTRLAVQVVEEVRKYFGATVYKTVIPRNVRLSEAPSYGQPVLAFDKRSKGAKCYQKLAGEVIKMNT
ncbi:ParA family protein [Ructibacterium gallinarum]|uniref:Sporulation initiation inhibitor protein Soj n=1 Tax=Ructibacterium gallinarum TaxID=2779355 RepID=A0A9D5RAL5_9FIRM|nr:AAA family ATPase [Ructibacterium gallinarum]MBE5039208.1 ParA family protein [Ructibacterium gallinarum]